MSWKRSAVRAVYLQISAGRLAGGDTMGKIAVEWVAQVAVGTWKLTCWTSVCGMVALRQRGYKGTSNLVWHICFLIRRPVSRTCTVVVTFKSTSPVGCIGLLSSHMEIPLHCFSSSVWRYYGSLTSPPSVARTDAFHVCDGVCLCDGVCVYMNGESVHVGGACLDCGKR